MQQQHGRAPFAVGFRGSAPSPNAVEIHNLDKINNNDEKRGSGDRMEYTGEESETASDPQHLLQEGCHPFLAGGNNTPQPSLSGAASSESGSLATPSAMLSPSSPSSSTSSSSEDTAAQFQACDADEGGASGAGYDIPQDHHLLIHRQSMPGHGDTEHEDALGELRQRLLYQESSGRKLSVDSSLTAAQRRVPMFVRTYREVAWKRVNKNHSKQKAQLVSTKSDLSTTPIPETKDMTGSATTVAPSQPSNAEFHSVEDCVSDVTMRPTPRSRAGSSPEVVQGPGGTVRTGAISEYVNGQHIKRGRVPIFITADPACPRRFSADDLVSMEEPQAQWTSRGRCLIIRPSQSANEAGQATLASEVSGTMASKDGQHVIHKRWRQDSSDYEFCLAEDDDDDDEEGDEDDEEDDDDDEDEEDEETDSRETSRDELFNEDCDSPFQESSSDVAMLASSVEETPSSPKKYLVKFSNSLHRLAMGNSTLKKTIADSERDTQGHGSGNISGLLDGSLSTFSTQQNSTSQSATKASNVTMTSENERFASLGSDVQSRSESYPAPPVSLPAQSRRTSVCWTLARPVDGTLPVNLQGAVPIGVEFVQSDALGVNGEPLWFQKMIFPPGVQVSSTQWSANSNWVPAVNGWPSSDQRRNRFLVRAEVAADHATDSVRHHHSRRVSDAYAPYDKNARNGVHAPRVVTLTVLPHGIDEAHTAESENHLDSMHPNPNHKTPHGVNGLYRAATTVSKESTDIKTEHTLQSVDARGGSAFHVSEIPSGTTDAYEVHATQARTQPSDSSQANLGSIVSSSSLAVTAPSGTAPGLGVRHHQAGPFDKPEDETPCGDECAVRGCSKKDGAMWQDILLSLRTEKRSVGVANWLLKGR
ncbi:hypothetical protein ElyMa_003818200 [Elysia marginata]|uniref:ZU5 domain-containing protein n=1 Tax=Elysia marginata TaxID=1093978 RepID=A0AAV4FEH0_9GAST|nr:hypothetical protein ElyMa_003818200 [Elysia marginata]